MHVHNSKSGKKGVFETLVNEKLIFVPFSNSYPDEVLCED